jgi:hypothetical protein
MLLSIGGQIIPNRVKPWCCPYNAQATRSLNIATPNFSVIVIRHFERYGTRGSKSIARLIKENIKIIGIKVKNIS